MKENDLVVIPRDAADRIAGTDELRGILALRYLPSERLYVVSQVQLRSGAHIAVTIPKKYETLCWRSNEYTGQWFRRPSEYINWRHLELLRRPDTAVSFEEFKKWVPGVDDPGNIAGLVITHDPDLADEFRDAGGLEFAGWLVNREGVQAIDIEVEPEQVGLIQLQDMWPLDRLSQDVVMVVGVGSIGGAVADHLASMGIGQTVLVDPDRFLWHNVVRHVLDEKYVGRLKVKAMKEHLLQRWPIHKATPLALDVVQMAHYIRPLIEHVDLVVCGADGIAPRRVVSHLAKRARKPSVLACVLNDGGVGEVLRIRPGVRHGCLLCHRAAIASAGGIDSEADQEVRYGTGLIHKPMTAIPSDLHMVGTFAAKTAVATLLESKHGEPYSLPGEHAVLGLRAHQDLAAPFDVARVGEVQWHDIPKPRPQCLTCSTP